MSEDGMVVIDSAFPVGETIDRLVELVTARGLEVFARIDHAAGASEAGLALRPTQLLLFGNAKGGTPLMQDDQTSGIDLPLKVLAWEDEGGRVFVAYNDPHWIADRHGLGEASQAAVESMTKGLAGLVGSAAKRSPEPQR